jgi:hypothetical protein
VQIKHSIFLQKSKRVEQIESAGSKLGFPSPSSNTVLSDFTYRHYVKNGNTTFVKQNPPCEADSRSTSREIPSETRIFH